MAKPRQQQSFSRYAMVLIAMVLIFTTFNLARWNNHNVVVHDIQSYYSYLPALFIYHDLTFQYPHNTSVDSIVKVNTWTLSNPEGRPVQKMSLGLAMLYSPFFLLSHGYAHLSNYAANGYTLPYQKGLAISSLVYALISLMLLRRLLLNYFSEFAVAMALLAVFLGTNLFFYIVGEGAMSHNYSFFLLSTLLFLLHKWKQQPSLLNFFAVGSVLGLIVVVRPINVLFALIPLAFAWKYRNNKWISSPTTWVTIAIGGLLAIAPQLAYWKYATGDWIYYSYSDEGFFFGNPALFKGLFSFRKGWFIYTPVMGLACLGFIYWIKQRVAFASASLIVLLLYLYVAFSWWCWWYGGSFGMRALIDVYPLLAFPLAALVDHFVRENTPSRLMRYTVPTVIGLLILLNQWQTFQYRKGILHYDGMTAELYTTIFWRQHYPQGYDALVDRPDYEAAKKGVNR